jgi:NAD(P)-dependent dehydrogenase (short-subunit alcohol dehydrogenase family)
MLSRREPVAARRNVGLLLTSLLHSACASNTHARTHAQGLGAQLAKYIARHGGKLILSARNIDGLNVSKSCWRGLSALHGVQPPSCRAAVPVTRAKHGVPSCCCRRCRCWCPQQTKATCRQPQDVLVLPFDLLDSDDKLAAAARSADEAFGGAGVDYLVHMAGESSWSALGWLVVAVLSAGGAWSVASKQVVSVLACWTAARGVCASCA